jgi:hypothetical protein
MSTNNERDSVSETKLEDLTTQEVSDGAADAVRGGKDKGPFPMVDDGKPTSAQAFFSSGAAIKA